MLKQYYKTESALYYLISFFYFKTRENCYC